MEESKRLKAPGLGGNVEAAHVADGVFGTR
jgi:hypothetical protein